jgi:signal transduction histidine kinase
MQAGPPAMAAGPGVLPADAAAPADPPRALYGSVFSNRARRLGIAWVGVALVLTAAAGTRVRTPTDFLLLMTGTGGLFTAPGIAVAAVTVRRVQGPFHSFWRYYLAGNIAVFLSGTAVFAHSVHARPVYRVLAAVALLVVLICDVVAIDQMMRTRSGARWRTVDLAESGLAVVALGAPMVVLRGSQLLASEWAWFGVMSIAFLVMFVSVLWCSVILFVRAPRGRRRSEGVAIALAATTVVDALVQVENVASGFALWSPPVLAFNGLCLGLLLLMPLYAQYGHAGGLERLPPQAQLRTGRVVSAVTFAGLVLVAGAARLADFSPSAGHVAVAALALLVALSAVRQLLTFGETRRLYAEVERSAEDRRTLLAAVVETMDDDRRRVAMQLHEQASSSYAALASLVSPDEWSGRLRSVPSRPVPHLLTARMAAQAESLRELIAAIRPLARASGAGLAPILYAYVDSLDDAVRPPVTRVEVAEGLVLDWITETIALRVVQEAVRNTCHHAEATQLRIAFDIEDDVAVVRITDDGQGFDVDGLVVESGIATMRRFLSFCDGQLRIRSERGGGTVVEARLGGPVPELPEPVRLRPAP